MKKLICILAGATLLGACEQSTTVSAPPASPAPEKKASDKAIDPNTFSRATKPKAPEAKMEANTTTASSPAP